MSQINSINPSVCRILRDEMDAALKAVGDKYGITIAVGGGKYTDSNVTFKVEAAVVNEDGQKLGKDAVAFQQNARYYGLTPEDLFKEFTFQGVTHQIVGLKPQSRKFPILAKNLRDGKTYKMTASSVCTALNNLKQGVN